MRYVRLYLLRDEFTIEHNRWVHDNGDETLRLNYPNLNSSSIVFDVGGYLGDFAFLINEKYDCTVFLLNRILNFMNIVYNVSIQMKKFFLSIMASQTKTLF